MDRSKEIYEGWKVGDFIDDMEPILDLIMAGKSWKKKLKDKAELKAWCKDNQPYYKKHIPDVVNYFAKKYELK